MTESRFTASCHLVRERLLANIALFLLSATLIVSLFYHVGVNVTSLYSAQCVFNWSLLELIPATVLLLISCFLRASNLLKVIAIFVICSVVVVASAAFATLTAFLKNPELKRNATQEEVDTVIKRIIDKARSDETHRH